MFRLDFSCKDCNTNRLNQIVYLVETAWNCVESPYTKDEHFFREINGHNCDDLAVDKIFYWNSHNTAELQKYIDVCFSKKELIAIIDHPEFKEEGYDYFDNYPLVAPSGYCWRVISLCNFRILKRHPVTNWTTTFEVVDNNLEFVQENSLREI